MWCIDTFYYTFNQHGRGRKHERGVFKTNDHNEWKNVFYMEKHLTFRVSLEKYFSLNWQQTWKLVGSTINAIWTVRCHHRWSKYVVEHIHKHTHIKCTVHFATRNKNCCHSCIQHSLLSIIYSNFPYSIVGRVRRLLAARSLWKCYICMFCCRMMCLYLTFDCTAFTWPLSGCLNVYVVHIFIHNSPRWNLVWQFPIHMALDESTCVFQTYIHLVHVVHVAGPARSLMTIWFMIMCGVSQASSCCAL